MGIRILIPRPRRRAGAVRARRFLWAAFGIALWGVAYTVFSAGGMVGSMRARAKVERLEHEVAAAEEANRALREEIEALRDDPGTIERYAREDLYLAKPGEKVYLLPELPDEDSNPAAGSRPSSDGESSAPLTRQ